MSTWLNVLGFLHSDVPVENSVTILEVKLLQDSVQIAGNMAVMETWNKSEFSESVLWGRIIVQGAWLQRWVRAVILTCSNRL